MPKQGQEQEGQAALRIAISGKGGVGKTTLTAIFVELFLADGRDVLAIDADADSNLPLTLGFDPDSVPVIGGMRELINERTDSKGPGSFFKINPKVDDLLDKYSTVRDGLRLLVMGGVEKGGAGCVCPASSFLKALMRYLVLTANTVVIMDMEAGVEHLGRATSAGVDVMLVVVQPDLRGVQTAHRVRDLASDLGIKRVAVVGNAIRDEDERRFVQENLKGMELAGFVPYSADFRFTEADKIDVMADQSVVEAVRGIKDKLTKGIFG